MADGVKRLVVMVEVKSTCGVCLDVKKICPICFPGVRSAKALHEELPKGCYAHCEGCHSFFARLEEESCDGIVVHWRYE